MVEINNQRKAFLDMLAWSEELITDVRKPEIMVMTSLWAESCCSYSDHPRHLSLRPKLKSTGAGRYQPSFPLVGCLPQAAWPERLLSKSQDAVTTAALRSVALYLWLIVVISVRQSTVALISGLHCRALIYGQFEHKADGLIANSKRSRNGQRLMYEQGHRDYLHSGYLHHRLPVMGC